MDSLKVLIIDDDSQMRNMLKQLLEIENHEVVTAIHGRDGVRKIQNENDFDLVITDLIMPEMEGLETIRELKKISPEVKIIAISGGGRIGPQGYLSVAGKIGANSVLEKPFTRKEILAKINELFNNTSS